MNIVGVKIKLAFLCIDGIYRECCPFCGCSFFSIKSTSINVKYDCGLEIRLDGEMFTYVIFHPCNEFKSCPDVAVLDKRHMSLYVRQLLSVPIGGTR